MEAVCARADLACQMRALAAALHSINLYCASISAALMCCCAPIHKQYRHSKQWRGQNVRGIASLVLCAAWCCDAAAALLRPAATVQLVAALMAPISWLAAAVFHVALWTRRSAAPVLYLAIYWMLTAISSATILWQHSVTAVSSDYIETYIQSVSILMPLVISAVDCVCFYDEVTKRFENNPKSGGLHNISYKHNDTHFYSKLSFFWLNPLLYKGYKSPLETEYFGELPDNERTIKFYNEFAKIYQDCNERKSNERNPSLFFCYICNVWPNFYIAGVLKLFGDMMSVIPPLGLAVIIQYIEGPARVYDHHQKVTLEEFFSNGYVMLLVVTMSLIGQAFLSQNSTHLVTVEGTRLKTALQSMVYDKCMRLAPWTPSGSVNDEELPLLQDPEEASTTRSGLITNLVSQDTYNIMSCVWICHYIWAIPLKITVILYLLYTKLGLSAIIGTAASVLIITPLQFYIGKKLSDNSKDISKCTDHRISKMMEILQGIDVIKLFVWEDLFKEKILQLREVELKLLNKDSLYWSFLTFTTQISTILITVITFTVYYFIDNTRLTAVNVFAGLAFFNQLTVPLLILPVTVLMVIQAMVSTKRIGDFLELAESNNIKEDKSENDENILKEDQWQNNFEDAMDGGEPDEQGNIKKDETDVAEANDQFSNDEMSLSSHRHDYVIRFRNAAFTWGRNDDTMLEIDDLDIPAGKLIMVVGATGSGKSSLLSAILGEMYCERGDVVYNRDCSMWYAGQPPWLLEGSVRDNIVMGSPWCQRKYGRVLRATGLRPDLQLLPEGDATRLGSHGAPLSGGQRIRVCVARALYSDARLLALDEPLAALDAALARHVVARALLPAARAGRTVIVATNRLELLHYADLVIAMEEGRVCGVGRAASGAAAAGMCAGAVARWARLASEARAAAARAGAGPPGGHARERTRLLRALSRGAFHTRDTDDTAIGSICEVAGAHLLSEVPTCAGGSWRRRPSRRQRPLLSRQLSSPPPSMYNYKFRPEVRRAVSADESNSALHREASVLRRFLRPRPLNRWTPRTLRRLISSDSEGASEDNQNNAEESMVESTLYNSVTSNGVDAIDADESTDNSTKGEEMVNECVIWRVYARACRWCGVAYWAAAVAAQGLAVVADCWLTYTTTDTATEPHTDEQAWRVVRTYAAWCAGGALAAGAAQACGAGAGAAARRALHERLLHAALRAAPARRPPPGAALHRFSADILVIDKKLPTAISRWTQLALLCAAAVFVNAVVAPSTLLASVPAVFLYFTLQSVYLCNARELQSAEARSAASVVSLCAETCAGGSTIRAGRLQTRMRDAFMQRLDTNHNTLLLLNAANRWLGLALDLVGAAIVCISLGVCLHGGEGAGGGARAGLAGAYSLLLPAYLAHLAKCRADLHLQLAALERVHVDTNTPQEDYREDCPIPKGWQRNGKIEFENVSVQHEAGTTPILNNINFTISPGEKVAICGRSGSGKSTLLLTCVGATTICSGRVLIDGEDVRRVPLRALRHRVVVVPQEPALFSGTLRENLDPLAVHTDEEIWNSLRAVGLLDFVSAQPAGLECSMGGRCGRGGWSAGRAARVCAARAALHARLGGALLLDEAGAALDAPAERALLDALAAVAPHATILTVAHRVSSVRGYERAIVLEAGAAVEQGAVAALLAQPSSRLARMLANANRIT